MRFYYFYKITNTINGKFYYGVHETDNLNDGYMGSGIAIRKAYKKYGIENFQKEILNFFNNSEEMYAYEEKIVTNELVNNQQCYNMIIGGRNKNTSRQLEILANQAKSTDEYRQKVKDAVYKYWHTGDIEAKKKKQSEGNKKYWTTGDVEAKKKHHSEAQLEGYRKHPERSLKLKEALYNRWNGEDGKENRRRLGESLRKSSKRVDVIQHWKETGKFAGYDNPDFQARWKKLYDDKAIEICELLKHSNLPDAFIVYEMYGKNVHLDKILKYYNHCGLLPEKIDSRQFTDFYKLKNDGKGHKCSNNKKTIYSNEIKYDFMIFYEDFFSQFEKIVEFMNDDAMSDSKIFNNAEYDKLVPNFFQVIEYFEKMGVVSERHTILIRVPKTVSGRSFTVPAQKTKFKVDYKGVVKTLIDKEMNEYGIDDNGKPFCKGRFELEDNGEKRSL